VMGVLAEANLSYPHAFAVARRHTLGRLRFAELAGELLALRVDPRELPLLRVLISTLRA
jgi:hypothetical protein